jgi:hypothetical protein
MSRRLAVVWNALTTALLIVATPLVEKNPAKVLAARAPVVLSMARVVVLAFAVVVLRQVWLAGVAAWPDAMVSIAVVLALPVVGALERVRPADVLSLAKEFVGRLGTGGVREVRSVYHAASTEPSKFDDHRVDAPSAEAAA